MLASARTLMKIREVNCARALESSFMGSVNVEIGVGTGLGGLGPSGSQ